MAATQAGWYLDPDPDAVTRSERYWDGHAWSHQVRAWTGTVDSAAPAPDQAYRAPAPAATTPDGQLLASWWIRVGAFTLDVVILVPILAVASLPSVITHWHSISSWWNEGVHGAEDPLPRSAGPRPAVFDPSTGPGLVLAAVLFLVALLYFATFLRTRQATPGKLLIGLQVRPREHPGRLSWESVLARMLVITPLVASVFLPAIGHWLLVLALVDCLWAAWDPNRQTLHDKVAGTNVVVLRR